MKKDDVGNRIIKDSYKDLLSLMATEDICYDCAKDMAVNMYVSALTKEYEETNGQINFFRLFMDFQIQVQTNYHKRITEGVKKGWWPDYSPDRTYTDLASKIKGDIEEDDTRE